MTKQVILIGNSFPFSLVRRKIRVVPVENDKFCQWIAGAEVYSFWGHGNTLAAAGEAFGIDLTPEVPRPVLQLDAAGFPVLNKKTFKECFLIVPRYNDAFRPAIGEEVALQKISSWQVLNLIWE